MAELVGNLLVAQSGGPTAVINASLAGVIQEAGKNGCIEEIYGGLNGILGILNEDLIDLNDEKARAIEGLKYTPGAALGTSRYKVDFKKKAEAATKDMDRLFEVFAAHNIRYFFYIGGNDSQDTSNQIHQQAVQRNYELRVIGVPKTIDNDLPHTDHCPGFGSAVKYNATTVMEVALDVGGMATEEGSCCIIEVMGRTAGWIAAGTILAKRNPDDAPHIILVPEIPFNEEAFLSKVKEVVERLRSCVVVVGEGLKDNAGNELGADKSRLDAFGHPVLSGASEKLAELVQGKLNTKTRTVKLGYAQRAAAHIASQRDIDEAAMCGEAAVKAAIDGRSGFMVKIVRNSNDPYNGTTDLQDLNDIANAVHSIPREWMSEDGLLPNEQFIQYVRPLIEGEPKLAYEGGLPKYTTLSRSAVDKVLPAKS
jgi:6-phosphofructokinase